MAFDVGSIFGDLKLETSGFRKSVDTINKGQVAMTKKAGGASSAFKGLWKQMAVGIGVTQLISRGIRAIGNQITDTIKQGREFGREWANVTTMLSISKEETEKLKKALIGISPTLGDTTELARGMYQVLSASIEPAKAVRFLGEAAKAAKAGVTEVATAVDALTTVINAYGMSADKVTDISDIMFQTVKRGKLTFGELAQSLGTVAPVAGTIGIKFEEVAAAIATLTRQGIPANKATMQMRQVLMAVLKPSADAKKTAKELGIEWTVAALKAKGLGKFLFELKEKTRGDTAAMAALVPNVRALTGVMALAGRASEGFAKDLKLMADASGSTEIAFQKQMESADFWIETLKNAIGKFKISFFQGFITPIREGIGTSKELEIKLDILSYKLQELGKDIGKTLSTLRTFFGYISTGVTKGMLGMVGSFADNVTGIKKSLKELEVQGYLTATNFQKSLKNIEIPFEKIREELEKGKKSFAEWSKKVKESDDAISKAKQPLVGWIGAVTEITKKHREHIRALLEESETSDESRKKIDEYLKSLKDLSEGHDKKLIPALKTTIPLLKSTATAAYNLYQRFGEGKISVIELTAGLQGLRAEVERIKDPFKDLAQAESEVQIETEGMVDSWNVLKTAGVPAMFHEQLTMIEKLKQEVIDTTEEITIRFRSMTERFIDLALDMGDTFGNFAMGVMDKGSTLSENLKGLWTDIGNSFKSMVADFIADEMKKLFLGIVSKTTEMASSVVSGISAIGPAITGIATGIAGLITSLATAIATAAQTLAAAAPALLIVLGIALAAYAGFKFISSLFKKKLETGTMEAILRDISHIQLAAMLDKMDESNFFASEMFPKIDYTNSILAKSENILRSIRGYIKKMVEKLGSLPSAQFGAILTSPGLVETHGTLRSPEIIMPQRDLINIPQARDRAEVNLTIRNDFYFNNQVDPNFTQQYVERSVMPAMMNKLETGVMKTKLKEILGVS